MSRCAGRRWRRRQARTPRSAPVVEGGEVGHADGEAVAHFETLPETRTMPGVSSRFSAHVELRGERQSARGAGRPALRTG